MSVDRGQKGSRLGTAPARHDAPSASVYGAIDLGTSSCRLLVAKPETISHPVVFASPAFGSASVLDSAQRQLTHAERFQVLTSYARNVRLGEGVSETGALCEAAMTRAFEALRQIDNRMAQYGVTRIRAVATAACRRASNSLAFLDQIHDELGLKIDIIDPQEEARLALAGCEPLLDEDRPYGLVFDIGGGSTQVIWLKREAPPCARDVQRSFGQENGGQTVSVIATHSVPEGVVSLTERYGSKLCDPFVFDDCVARIAGSIQSFCQAHGVKEAIEAGKVQMIGASGTVTTIAGIEMGLKRYVRSEVDGATLSFRRILCLTGFLRDLREDELRAQPCIGEERAELMRAGCAILEALCSHWPVGRLRVADRGLREGMLLDMMRQDGAFLS